MAMRSIVCLFDGAEGERSALQTAISLARRDGGHLKVVHACRTVSPPVHAAPGGLFVDTGWLEAVERQRKAGIEAAMAATAELAAAHDLPLDPGTGVLPRIDFVVVEEKASELVRELALSDLILVGSARGADLLAHPAVEVAMFSTRRPLLVVRPQPEGAAAPVPQGRCAIAWNGSPEAIHALVTARPMIERAAAVTLFATAAADREGPTRGQAAALDYLAAHGLSVALEKVETGEATAAEALLGKVRGSGADYVVMGAYGHSVFREMVLGGFTQHMLHDCELPLLLCH